MQSPREEGLREVFCMMLLSELASFDLCIKGEVFPEFWSEPCQSR